MAENTGRQSSRDSQVRRHFISECRDSRIVVQAKFSPNMLRIYRRHFDGMSRSAYLLRFYCRIGPGNTVESELAKEIMSLIDEVNATVQKKITVADQILKNENVTVSKAGFETINATIIDPLANQFLRTLMLAQELDEKLSALWLSCLINDEQKRQALSEIDSDLRSIQGKVRGLSLGLRNRVREQNQRKPEPNEMDVEEVLDQGGEPGSVEVVTEIAEKKPVRSRALKEQAA